MPRLYAHRGAAAELPENTIPSFARALELGATALEMDVHMTADGHIVVSHDPTTLRTTGIPLTIRNTSWADVRVLDAGYGFTTTAGGHPFRGGDMRIPLFEDVLREFPTIRLNVDVKQRRPSMVDRLLELIAKADATERVLLASFHLSTMLAIRRRGYRGETGLSQPEVAALFTLPGALLRHRPWPGTAVQIPTQVGPIRLSAPSSIRKCHSLGLRVDYWTINDPSQARYLLAAGADGIMTDDPRAIAPVLCAFKRR